MGRAILLACLPWAALLLVLVACLYLILRFNHSRARWSRIMELHRDEVGGVQSLGFVLTLPFFVIIMLFIVQVSQLMVATVVVHYSAFAAARSAIVWIPSQMTPPEGCNRIGLTGFPFDVTAEDHTIPVVDPTDSSFGPGRGGLTYTIDMSQYTPKQRKIITSAGMALLPIGPSRDLGLTIPPHATYANDALDSAYKTMVPSSTSNSRISARLRNKLAYVMENTWLRVQFFHKNSEPPLYNPWGGPYYKGYDPGQFYPNEVGWQDTVTVTVYHNLALLPGPGRLLARRVVHPEGIPDYVADKIQPSGDVYKYLLHASATMQNEGEIPVLPYVQD